MLFHTIKNAKYQKFFTSTLLIIKIQFKIALKQDKRNITQLKVSINDQALLTFVIKYYTFRICILLMRGSKAESALVFDHLLKFLVCNDSIII